jgi:DNA-binding transcriptional MerR regulator
MNGNRPGPEPENERLPIGEIARRAGVSVDTIRHYERRGLIAPAERTASGYRLFRAAAVQRVLEVRAAVELGFGLDELAKAIAARESGAPACRSVRELLAEKGAELDRRIEELIARRARVAATLKRWDRRLATTPAGQPAHLLRSLAPGAVAGTPGPRRSLASRPGSQPPGKGSR